MQAFVIAAVIAAVIAGLIGLAILAHRAARARREALAAFAHRLGWEFDPAEDGRHVERFAQFEAFQRGHTRIAYNTLRGSFAVGGSEYAVTTGDYLYKETHGSGTNRRTTTHRISYLVARMPFVGLPSLLIRKEGLGDKIAGAIGFDDIDFESEEFSRRFWVKSSDKRFAYDIVHPRMMEWLLQEQGPPIDLQGGCCCVAGDRTWEPAQFERTLEFVRGFFALWPPHLVATLAGEPKR